MGVTAVIVNNALEVSANDDEHQARVKEQERQDEFKALELIFMEMDEDGNGDITKEEIIQGVEGSRVIREKLTLLEFTLKDLVELFDLLDDDEEGSLSAEAFIAG